MLEETLIDYRSRHDLTHEPKHLHASAAFGPHTRDPTYIPADTPPRSQHAVSLRASMHVQWELCGIICARAPPCSRVCAPLLACFACAHLALCFRACAHLALAVPVPIWDCACACAHLARAGFVQGSS